MNAVWHCGDVLLACTGLPSRLGDEGSLREEAYEYGRKYMYVAQVHRIHVLATQFSIPWTPMMA